MSTHVLQGLEDLQEMLSGSVPEHNGNELADQLGIMLAENLGLGVLPHETSFGHKSTKGLSRAIVYWISNFAKENSL